jgi:hypothetical protein
MCKARDSALERKDSELHLGLRGPHSFIPEAIITDYCALSGSALLIALGVGQQSCVGSTEHNINVCSVPLTLMRGPE